MSDNYKQWYDDAMCASNAAGYSGMTAAQTIEFMHIEWKGQHARITELEAQLAAAQKDVERLSDFVTALDLISIKHKGDTK